MMTEQAKKFNLGKYKQIDLEEEINKNIYIVHRDKNVCHINLPSPKTNKKYSCLEFKGLKARKKHPFVKWFDEEDRMPKRTLIS